jgi:hypothetical protein
MHVGKNGQISQMGYEHFLQHAVSTTHKMYTKIEVNHRAQYIDKTVYENMRVDEKLKVSVWILKIDYYSKKLSTNNDLTNSDVVANFIFDGSRYFVLKKPISYQRMIELS